MTIGTNQNPVSYTCNGVTTVFAVPIQAYAPTDFEVFLVVTATGVATLLTLNSDYTLATSGTLSPTAWTLTSAGALSPYATGNTLQIVCNPVQSQQTQYVQGQAFPSSAVQTNVDRLTQMVQYEEFQLLRTVRGSDAEIAAWPVLAPPASRKGQALIFDANGLPAVGASTSAAFTTGNIPFFGTDSGAANAYVVTLVAPPLTFALAAGALVRFTAANANTGPSTVNVAGIGAIAIVGQLGTTLAGGEIPTTGPTWLQYTGSAWQIVGTGAYPDRVRSASEISAGVIPVNYLPLPGVLTRYGNNTVPGTTDMSTAMTNALAANAIMTVPPGTYLLTLNAGWTVYAKRIIGAGSHATYFIYTGTGVCFTVGGTDSSPPGLSGFSLDGTAAGAGGIRLNQAAVGVRHGIFSDVWVSGFAGGTAATAITFTSGPLINAVSATLNAVWAGATGSYICTFSDGENRLVPLTNGSAAVVWNGPLTAGVTTAATVTGSNVFAWDLSAQLGAGIYYNLFQNCSASGTATGITFTGVLAAGATSATLNANWAGATRTYVIQFSDGEARPALLTNGSAAVSWLAGLVNAVSATASAINSNANGWRIYSSDGVTNGNRCNANDFIDVVSQWNAGDGFLFDWCTGNTCILDREQNGGFGINTDHIFDLTLPGGYSENNFGGWIRKTVNGSVRAFGGQVVDSGTSLIAIATGDVFMVRPAVQPVFGDTGGVGFSGALPPSGGSAGFNWPGGADVFFSIGNANIHAFDHTNVLFRFLKGMRLDSVVKTSAAGALSLAGVQQNIVEVVLFESITSITMPTAVDGFLLILQIKQAAAGGPFTVAGFPAAVKLAGAAYTMTATASKIDKLSLRYNSDQAAWLEESRSQNM